MFGSHLAERLSKNEQTFLLNLARKTIEARLCGDMTPSVDRHTPHLDQERAAFVTLLKDESLRGCIGYTRGVKPLYQAVQELAEFAAFRDPRFRPLQKNELGETTIEISVLTPLRKINSVKKIKTRRHGVSIRLGESQGLLLPQVASKNRWDRQTFLEHVCLKANLDKNAWQNPQAEILIFEAQVFKERKRK